MLSHISVRKGRVADVGRQLLYRIFGSNLYTTDAGYSDGWLNLQTKLY